MASRRASLASAAVLRSSAVMRRLSLVPGVALVASACSTLQSGQRFANPGLSGFSSNSSEHKAQTLIGNGITSLFYDACRYGDYCRAEIQVARLST